MDSGRSRQVLSSFPTIRQKPPSGNVIIFTDLYLLLSYDDSPDLFRRYSSL